MHQKRLIAVDLDGTLFGADHQISPRTVEVLYAVQQRGHAIVVVTGRSAHSAIPRLGSLPANTRIVCSNGAYEYNQTGETTVWSAPLLSTTVTLLRERIIKNMADASFGWETVNGLSFEQKFINEAGGAHTLEQGGTLEAFGKSDVLKLYVRSPRFVRGDLQRALLPVVSGSAEVSTSGAPFVELTAPGVDKASGLARVAADLGYAANSTIAFGDNLNDLPMLQWASESVAMGNALDEVKAITTTQTTSNIDEGVAAHLQKKLQNGEL